MSVLGPIVTRMLLIKLPHSFQPVRGSRKASGAAQSINAADLVSDRSCTGGENGFNQAIELSADALANVKFVQEKRLISKFFGATDFADLASVRKCCICDAFPVIKSCVATDFSDLACAPHVFVPAAPCWLSK